MADVRIYSLTENTTPAAGDFLAVDKSGNAAALKVNLNKFLLASGTVAGAASQAQTFTNGLVANESGADSDTRVEGDTDQNLLFVDAGADRIGVGTAAPDSKLHVSQSSANTSTVQQLVTLTTNSTGTAAAGFGSRVLWELESSTTDDTTAAYLDVAWQVATHGSRSSRVALWMVYNASPVLMLHNYADATALGRNIFFGQGAGNTTLSPAGGANTLASDNTGAGYSSLASLTTGYANATMGSFTGQALTTGWGNVAIGTYGLYSASTGLLNTAVGYGALFSNNGQQNVAIGFGAGYYETGNNKLFIDNATRASEAAGRTDALIYGVFDATVANQELTFNCGKMGFFNTAAVAKPTGVAVSAAGIHAALVTLGLIAA